MKPKGRIALLLSCVGGTSQPEFTPSGGWTSPVMDVLFTTELLPILTLDLVKGDQRNGQAF
ncbi:hypothetical protein PF003_g23968 [Phytophthora fragariae]|nr:hypothetical protein PF003_g23968 [Phytophthora fragariae]